MKKSFIRICLILIVGIFAIIFSLFIWIILPEDHIDLKTLVPQEHALYLSLNTDWANKEVLDLFSAFRINPLIRFFLPRDMFSAVSFNLNSEEVNYLILMQNSRLAKLTKILRPWVKDRIARPYFVFKGVIIISKELKLLQDTLRLTKKGYKQNRFTKISDIDIDQARYSILNISILADNRNFQLSKLVRHFEEEYYFSVFPSVIYTQSIEGYISVDQIDKFEGKMRFKLYQQANIEEVSNDIYFLKQLIYRLTKANYLNFQDKVNARDDYVDFIFSITGLEGVLENYLIKR